MNLLLLTGEDIGEVYGQLITCKTRTSPTTPQKTTGTSRKRKKRRKRATSALSLATSGKRDSKNAEIQDRTKLLSSTGEGMGLDSDTSTQPSSSVGSSLLVPYGDSGGSSGESDTGGSSGHLPIPAAILDMYESDNKSVAMLPKEQVGKFEEVKLPTLDSDEDETLGFFEPVDSYSEQDDDDGDDTNNGGLLPMAPSGGAIPEVTKHWSAKKAQWVFGQSQLCSYTCWKCSNVGHLAQDCTVAVRGSGSGVGSKGSGSLAGGLSQMRIPQSVQDLLATCREVRRKKGQRCADCGLLSNLVSCLDCG